MTFAPMVYLAAAVAEIAGCFAVWAWLKVDKSAAWLLPGIGSLVLFAYLLTLIDGATAGRAYAAYRGIYICASLGWLWIAEGVRADRWDRWGALVCALGAGIILLGPHR
jgi:small multidrug resistance family-3 protein